MKQFRENFFIQFTIISFVVLAVIAVVISTLLTSSIRSHAIESAIDEAVGHNLGQVINSITPADLETPMTGERYDRFNEFVQQTIVSERTARVKLWLQMAP